ncbi:hypothetical protein GEMRC1_014045 [Eukaryota sp. GEM-RC1]
MKSSLIYLQKQFQYYQQNPIDNVYIGLCDDCIYKWSILIHGPQGTVLEGGLFRCIMSFPEDFPMSPPSFKFLTKMFHPNIYESGAVCISILHNPTDLRDIEMSGELAEERWLPIHTIESVLISIINLLLEPNPDSPADIDAAVLFRNDRKKYMSRQRRIAADSVDEFC